MVMQGSVRLCVRVPLSDIVDDMLKCIYLKRNFQISLKVVTSPLAKSRYWFR